ncbi:MAG: ABC transporter permease [Lachnospiraceae bacterium]|nr:ABC transporter permease [Lachnospiraceae bacterium]
MFRNFSKVVRFTFHNQTSKAYKIFTIIVSLLLLIVPSVIMLISCAAKSDDEDKAIDACGAKTIYYVNEVSDNEIAMEQLNLLHEENYDDIRYVSAKSAEDACEDSGEDSLVLLFEENTSSVNVSIIIPEKSNIDNEDAKNYFEFVDKYEQYFLILVSGIDFYSLNKLSLPNEYETYDETGYMDGYSLSSQVEKNDEKATDEVLEIFRFAMPYISLMLLYFMILMYGNTITMNMIMEKESKLMDTMLITLKPESLIFGKLLGCILAGLLQLMSWVLSISLGMFIGTKITKQLFPDSHLGIVLFFDAMKELNIFRPVNVILAVLFIIFGFVMYSSIAAIAGALSNSKEDAGNKTTIFVLPLIISFFALFGLGGLEGRAPAVLKFIPFTAALIMPADLSLGQAGLAEGIISFIIMIIFTLVFVTIAGRIYKMTSLFKGNRINSKDVLGNLLGKG